ncbi:hypothetical protein D3C71_2148000 [compost metagenome]
MHRNVSNLLRGKCSPAYRIGLAVDAISTVIDAAVGHQHLEQRNAASVCGKAVADSKADRVAQASGLAGAL